MNEKEARELTDGLICEFNDWDEKKKYAFGYLEAIEKAKVLEEALYDQCTCLGRGSIGQTSCKYCQLIYKWEKEK